MAPPPLPHAAPTCLPAEGYRAGYDVCTLADHGSKTYLSTHPFTSRRFLTHTWAHARTLSGFRGGHRVSPQLHTPLTKTPRASAGAAQRLASAAVAWRMAWPPPLPPASFLPDGTCCLSAAAYLCLACHCTLPLCLTLGIQLWCYRLVHCWIARYISCLEGKRRFRAPATWRGWKILLSPSPCLCLVPAF